jgi:hypothetical protein
MGKNQDPGSRIRDKHPGSATLIKNMIEKTSHAAVTLKFYQRSVGFDIINCWLHGTVPLHRIQKDPTRFRRFYFSDIYFHQ